MIDLEISVMAQGPDPAGALQPLLERFEAGARLHVRVGVLPWETGWAEIVKFALYSHGPDVSEVGTTWIGNLSAMNALRPFTAAEVSALGGRSAFLPASWQSGILHGEPEVWSIPWLADTRVIYYRRDLLERAGIDPAAAFRTHADLARTLQKLQESGVSVPWVVPTAATLNTLHLAASWVWGAGGDFVDPHSRQFTLAADAALAGLRNYFGLERFLAPEARHLDPMQSNALFLSGRAAVTMSGPQIWGSGALAHSAEFADVAPNIAASTPPGVPFVGGSSLVLWRHSALEADAVRLIRVLANPVVQAGYSQRVGNLPTRLDVLDTPLYTEDPIGVVMSQALRSGRSFPTLRLWGLVEDRLSATLAEVWADVLAASRPNLEALLEKHLDPLVLRLNRTFSNQ